MGYRIEYEPSYGPGKRRTPKLAVLTALCMLLFLLLVNTFWIQGKQALRELLLPGDAAVTASALEDLARDLREGENLSFALGSFCKKVIEEAKLDPG